jgi:hypothetical protein
LREQPVVNIFFSRWQGTVSAVVNLAPAAVAISGHKGRAQAVGAWCRKTCTTFIVIHTGICGVGVFNNRIRTATDTVNNIQ